MSMLVPLTKGLHAIVDDADFEKVTAIGSWCASITPKGAYALRGIAKPDGSRTTIRLHNLLTGLRFVDHINGDGLDNRRANLRPSDHVTNGRNAGKKSNNTSGFKGVTWDRRAGKWLAQIQSEGRHHHLGHFIDARDAAVAYDAAALRLHGEFARTNFSTSEAI